MACKALMTIQPYTENFIPKFLNTSIQFKLQLVSNNQEAKQLRVGGDPYVCQHHSQS
jgi:hypothetical protein